MKNNKLISVIIPTYNRGHILYETLNSIYNQTYRPIEILLIDDGSTDNTEEIVKSFTQNFEAIDFKIKYFKQNNKGAPSARNYGIKKSIGDFIQFLDSDDTITNEKFSVQIKALESSNAEIAICDYLNYKIEGSERKLINRVRNFGNIKNKVVKGGSISIFTPLIRSCLVHKAPLWNTKMSKNQDMDYLLKIFLLCTSYIYTPGYFCIYNHYSINRISDLYYNNKPAYKKRLISLLLFFINNCYKIPIKNILFTIVALVNLLFCELKFNLKKIIKNLFPIYYLKLKNIYSSK